MKKNRDDPLALLSMSSARELSDHSAENRHDQENAIL